MNRREFLKISCSGLITLYLSGVFKRRSLKRLSTDFIRAPTI